MSNFAKSHNLPTFEERRQNAPRAASLFAKWVKADKVVDLVYCDIANGLTNTEIYQKLTRGVYDVLDKPIDDRTAYDYIRAAHERMHYDFEEKLPQMREDLYLKFMSVYQECIEKGDRYNAIGALQGLMKLTGIDKPAQTNVQINNSTDGVTINFGFKKDEETDGD